MSMNWIGCLYHSIQHDPSEKPRESPTLPPYVGCRMSACRFCCPNGDILCRVGDIDVVSATVSKATQHVRCSRHVG